MDIEVYRLRVVIGLLSLIIIIMGFIMFNQYNKSNTDKLKYIELNSYNNTLEARLDRMDSITSFYENRFYNDSITNRMKDSIILIKLKVHENKIDSILNDSNIVNDYYEKLRTEYRFIRK